MSSDTILSKPALSNATFDALPDPVRSYIRYLEAMLHRKQDQIQQLKDLLHDLKALSLDDQVFSC